MAKSAAMKMIVGRTWKAKMTPYCAPSGPRTVVMIFGQTTLLPSGPNTKLDPTNAKSSRWLMTLARALNTRWPNSVFSTMSANRIWRLRPHTTVRRSMARRFVEKQYAIARITMSPVSGWRRGRCPKLAATAQPPAAAAGMPVTASSRPSYGTRFGGWSAISPVTPCSVVAIRPSFLCRGASPRRTPQLARSRGPHDPRSAHEARSLSLVVYWGASPPNPRLARSRGPHDPRSAHEARSLSLARGSFGVTFDPVQYHRRGRHRGVADLHCRFDQTPP